MADKINLKREMFNDLGRKPKPRPAKEPAPEPENDETIRINVRVTKEMLEYLKTEAKENATTVSALTSLAIGDWIANRKIVKGINNITTVGQARYNIAEQLRDPETQKAIAAILSKKNE